MEEDVKDVADVADIADIAEVAEVAEVADEVDESEEADVEAVRKESMLLLEGYRQGSGMSKEDLDEAVGTLQEMVEAIGQGRISVEHVRMAIHAKNYDRAVAEARREGELAGRNTRIEQLMPELTGGRQDNTPRMPSAGPGRSKAQVKPSIFSLAGEAR